MFQVSRARSLVLVIVGFIVVVTSLERPVRADANAVLSWNAIANQAHWQAFERFSLNGWRSMAVVQVAVFEAVNAIVGRYQPYALTLTASPSASVEAAVAAAAQTTLSSLYPSQHGFIQGSYESALTAIPDGQAKNDGIAVGQAAGAGILSLRSGDGWYAPPPPYTVTPAPGIWRPTLPNFSPPFGRQLANATPWTMSSPAQFRPGPPPDLTSAQYAADVNEVKSVGEEHSKTRGHDGTVTAQFWLAESVTIMWHPLARDVAFDAGLDQMDTARMFALMTMSMMDGAVASFDTKYHYNQWRPITAIREADTDGNPATVLDPSWTPLLFTPSFPDYISTHCAATTPGLRVLQSVVGDRPLSINSEPGPPRSYSGWNALINECIVARVYGGIHFRTSDVVGVQVGEQVAQQALSNFLRPR